MDYLQTDTTEFFANTPFRYVAVIKDSNMVAAAFQRLGACKRFVQFAQDRDAGKNCRGFEVFDCWAGEVVPLDEEQSNKPFVNHELCTRLRDALSTLKH